MAFTPRTQTTRTSSSSSSLVIDVPTGTVDGDILFLWAGLRNTAGYVINSIDPSWVLLGSSTANSDKHYLYYKIASSEPASYTVGTTGASKFMLVMSCYTSGDFNGADPIDAVSNTGYRTSNTTVRAASFNVATANSYLVFFAGMYYTSAAVTYTKPADIGTDVWTEDLDFGHTAPDFYLEICSMLRTASGATGDIDATASASSAAKHAFAVALKPAAVGGGTAVPVFMHHLNMMMENN